MNHNPFPKWLRERDWLMARAEENHVYQLFRVRREDHGKGGIFRQLRASTASLSIGYVTAVAAVVVLSIGLFALLNCCAIPLIVLMAMVLQHALSSRALNQAILPRRISDVFGNKGFYRQPARDLWMCGYGGREILEAIYLENWEKGMYFRIVCYWIAVVVFTFIMMAPAIAGEYYPSLLLALSFFVSAIIMYGFIIGSFRSGVIKNTIQPKLDSWKPGSHAGRTAARGIGEGMLWFLILIGVGGLSAAIIGVLISDLADTLFEFLVLGIPLGIWILALIILAGAITARCFQSKYQDAVDRRIERVMAQADEVFDAFMVELCEQAANEGE